MPRQNSPTGTGSALRRYHDKEFFLPDGDVTFKVENTLFRVHKYFFRRESTYFQTLFRTSIPCDDPPGSSETNPVVLEDTTSEAFSGLCWVFYNPEFSIYTTTLEKWAKILALAQRWGFNQVEQLCVRELQKMSIPSVDKIHIYEAFRLDRSLLAESFVDLTIRPNPLNLDEAQKLGIENTLQIARARELSRGSDSGTRPSNIQLNGSELRSVIQNAFNLEEELFADFFTGSSSTPPPPPQPQPQHPPSGGDTGTRKQKK
ncbi:hypothetical protein F5888DRAFT_767296 [Russula emetica]|nr:hypothetical protein F5888DRAFT_767296 [Russula emetica]